MSAKATPTAATPQMIPVKYQFEGSLRRTAIDVPPRMQQLREKLAKSFPKFAHLFEARDQILRLTYVDDEGDEITITSNQELEHAYRFAQEAGKVLRFTVPSFESNTATRITSENDNSEKEAVPAQEGNMLTPADRRRLKKEKKAAARAAFLERKNEKQAARQAQQGEKRKQKKEKAARQAQQGEKRKRKKEKKAARQARLAQQMAANAARQEATNAVLQAAEEAACQQQDDVQDNIGQAVRFAAEQAMRVLGLDMPTAGPVVHYGVTCDRSGMSPILGPCFHKRGENYDLCEAEFNKITDPAERAQYVRLDVPQRNVPMRGPAVPVENGADVVHRGVSCDRSGVKPIRGIRYHKRGENYDLCQAEFDKITDEAEKAQYIRLDRRTTIKDWRDIQFTDGVLRHPGIVCDVTGQSPIVGPRYHKRGENYDICQKAFDALGEAEKLQFIRLDRPTKIFDFARESRRGGGRFFGRSWRHRDFGGPRGLGGPGCGSIGGPPGCAHPAFGNGHPAFGNGYPAFGGAHPVKCNWRRVWGGRQGRRGRHGKTRLEFVKDVTVPDGSIIAPGSRVAKTWELRASGDAIPAGVTLAFVDGADLQVSTIAVESVEGGNYQVTIEFDAPVEGGSYRSFYRFEMADGKQFGPRIWVDFVVKEAAEQEMTEDTSAKDEAVIEDDKVSPEPAMVETVETVEAEPAEEPEVAEQSSEDTVSSNQQQPVLAQVLAGINIAPDDRKAELATLLYEALDNQDFSAVIEKLETLKIHLE